VDTRLIELLEISDLGTAKHASDVSIAGGEERQGKMSGGGSLRHGRSTLKGLALTHFGKEAV
jgi:hypothetical protein